MRVSLVIAAHNEGDLLTRTVRSCTETATDLDYEIVVADDHSTDGCVEKVCAEFPAVRVVGHEQRRGCSSAKDLGARTATGDVLVFLDGHCKPERWAIERLVHTIERVEGRAIVTPRVPALDTQTWQNSDSAIGFGYGLNLRDLSCHWIPLRDMKEENRLYENPALIGCCLAMTKELYTTLWGFDRDMVDWGVEDLDLGLKAWLMGYSVLHNPYACIGHRFRGSFDNFSVADEAIPINQLRMARKNFTERVWQEWCEQLRERESEVWEKTWEGFSRTRESTEREREYLLAHRVRDEFWYAEEFGLDWPARPSSEHAG